ncbi:hypothetical protein SAMN06264364_11793 [Quadrisphaera granulorum]|uniref:Uncharacterized protein n=1 Tax=Quadrisphaera granulorum TaxID=317664 RepID=A0A316A4L2_9ACTN|nr:hypothetical protein [Quadrisphaera granulorum]PWJ52841.1 hypothetical protein BXY45_11793 [Quadrisphaera granulorum]SZE97446.1 hypothetical protein SAMN06264364_11793 [Quadrisphaera granulorum]
MFRYQLIRDAADPALSPRQRGAAVRALAARTHTDAFGNEVTYSRDHLDRWIRAWRGLSGGVVPARHRQRTRRANVV